ncbi:DUF1905 domain-containing protein [Fulvivirga sp. 29W222]|uniref:DUF1905 domain-containing protein n=1 Tax=Fulvivirga marina TaxID=2494733 RepID=A0A937G3B9_9BACT|nr:YdeI/OmpD-associated family protein [Fulvivirga marina]MBL6449917.1 DUF1905 domain-containing protein [Fulvivirga marina]
MTELIKKLKHTPGTKTLVLDLPEEINIQIAHDSIARSEGYGFVIIFVKQQDDVTLKVPAALEVSIQGCTLWVAYPKKSSAIKTDITRDGGWGTLTTLGYRRVSQISINDTWSALRFKPAKLVKVNILAKTQTFEATIVGSTDNTGGAWVQIPFDMEKAFGTKGQVKVKATFDGKPYQGSIANMGNGPILIVKKQIRSAIGKNVGDKVLVTIEKDKSERKVNIPTELQELLQQNPEAAEFYNGLSYTNRKEYALWVSTAKRKETKDRRLVETLYRLSNSIKNPFQK